MISVLGALIVTAWLMFRSLAHTLYVLATIVIAL